MRTRIAKYICSTTLATVIALGLVACSSDDSSKELQGEFAKVANRLTDKWDTGCLVNPQPTSDPDSPVGYLRDTLEINDITAVQTFEYFQDANCNIPVTSLQVANLDETFFLRKQSQQLVLSYPTGKTTTELGEAYHLDLQVISVSIDDQILTEQELQQRGITLPDLQGIIIVTESDRLHIGTAITTRPTSVPLDYFYTRSTD